MGRIAARRCFMMTLAAWALAALVPVTASGEPTRLGFADGWEHEGADTKVESYLDEEALRMRSGRSIRRDVRFQDGTIDFDVAVTGDRSFFYVQFRMESDSEHEELYFRPHKSALPDAIQYTPVYFGEGNWQLYHGEGGTAAADFPRHEWIHVKVVVSGSKAAVFVGNTNTPQLVIPRLARKTGPGYVALRSFLPGGQPEGVHVTSFANVVVRSGEIDFDFSGVTAEETRAEGVVAEWLVSDPQVAPDGPVVELPAASGWRKVEAEPSGLVVIGKHFARPDRRKRATALAKITLTSANDARVPFDLGYSDEVTVFLNGAPLFTADDSYRFDLPRREGLIGLDQATVYLPLRAGENELVLAVTEVFGGWGVMGRLGGSGSAVTVTAAQR
jgi:hypothetical protein